MYPFFFDATMLLLIPPLLLSLYAQFKVKSTFNKYSEVGTRAGLSGAQVAAQILRDAGIAVTDHPESYPKGEACGIEATPGALTDHYDPRAQVLRLSEPVYGGRSIAALGVAAHEVGHAIQHAHRYGPLQFRSAWVPVAGIGSSVGFFVMLIGLGLAATGGAATVAWIGVALFAATTVFTLVTLPVEFDASKRALQTLSASGVLAADEVGDARKVLNAAALTYVAAAAASLLQLLYWVFQILGTQRRND